PPRRSVPPGERAGLVGCGRKHRLVRRPPPLPNDVRPPYDRRVAGRSGRAAAGLADCFPQSREPLPGPPPPLPPTARPLTPGRGERHSAEPPAIPSEPAINDEAPPPADPRPTEKSRG